MKTKKRRIFILCSIILINILLSNVFAEVITYKPKYGTVNANNLNFRSSPTGSVIKTLPKETKVKLVGEIDNYYIAMLDSDQIGFVSKDFITNSNTSFDIGSVYTRFAPYTAYTTLDTVNLRRGPSTNTSKISTLSDNTKVTVIGQVDDFYSVLLSNDIVGFIQKDLLSTTDANENTSDISIQDVVDLLNKEREKTGLSKLVISENLNKIAGLKAIDLATNNYFLHTSESYGTPFEMMQNFGITYNSAGENIAQNEDVLKAVTNWTKDTSNSKNILNPNFENVGIGIHKDKDYGFAVVAMFTEDLK